MQFYQKFDFSQESFTDPIFTSKVVSCKLKDNLNSKAYEFLKDVGCIVNDSKINEVIINDLIEAAYVYFIYEKAFIINLFIDTQNYFFL